MTTTDTPTIEEIREARAKITPAPWVVYRGRLYPHIKSVSGAYIHEYNQAVRREDDAEFIANAPRYIDFLLAEVERLKAEVERLNRPPHEHSPSCGHFPQSI